MPKVGKTILVHHLHLYMIFRDNRHYIFYLIQYLFNQVIQIVEFPSIYGISNGHIYRL
jgi:hypothetical protein